MENALEIINLKKTYSNKTTALKGISFNVKSGDFFALLGPNGAGKSTCIGIITSLVNKTEGQVKIFGKDLKSDEIKAKKLIGLVPQEFNFSMFVPVEEILLDQAGYFGIDRNTAKKRAEKFLKMLDLWEKRKVESRMLSGGMKRRLMIARALMHNPKLLILDEPTAGVDIEIRRTMWDFLKKLNEEGTTIILTTHYLEEAESLCKNIAIINKGEIIENTSMKELLRKLDKETFIFDTKEDTKDFKKKKTEFNFKFTDDKTIEVEVSKKDSLNEIFEIFSENKIEVLSMRNKSNRLEELFINIVEGSKK